MNRPALFRPEAVDAQHSRWESHIVLAPTGGMRAWATFALALTIAALALLTYGHYTRRVRVEGQIVPAAGAIRIVAPQFGRIARTFVAEDQTVDIGAPLFEINAERDGANGGVDGRISATFASRRTQITAALGVQTGDMRSHAAALAERERMLRVELEHKRAAIRLAQDLVADGEAKLRRERKLERSGFLSPARVADVNTELLAKRAQVREQQVGLLTTEQELLAVQDEIRSTEGKIALAHNEADRALASLDQEVAEHEGRSRIVITAPAAGTVTALAYEVGQTVQGAAILATLLPTGSVMEAHLMVPSRASGFIASGQRVRLRLSAFPYQKFGQVKGTVAHVERSPAAAEQSNGGERLYRVRVRLDRQGMEAYGRVERFKPGMALEADIEQDRRRLIEWLFDPLVSVARRQ